MASNIERQYLPFALHELQEPMLKVKTLPTMSNPVNYMGEYLSDQFDEKVVLDLLFSERKREGLSYLDEHLKDGKTILIFNNKTSLFKGFASALQDSNQSVRAQCLKIVSKIIPQLASEMDTYMSIIMADVVSNMGSPSVTLQKESLQTLHISMKHSCDVFQIFKVIALKGMQNPNVQIREHVMHKFPTLLFPEFHQEDFFDILHGLASNLVDISVDKELTFQTVKKLKEFLGDKKFNSYVEQLPGTVKATFVSQLTACFERSKMARSASEHSSYDGHHNHRAPEPRHDVVEHQYLQIHREQSEKYSNSSYQLGFIPNEVLERLSDPDASVRLQAGLEIKHVIADERNADLLRHHIISVFSIIQPMLEDQSTQVVVNYFRIFDVIVGKLGNKLSNYLKVIVLGTTKKFGCSKDVIRSEVNKLLLHTMQILGPEPVREQLWSKLQHRQAKVREDTINIIIASLLKISPNNNKIESEREISNICNRIAPLLLDPRPVVRQACLDCFALIAHLLGGSPKSLQPISKAVDQVELHHDDATGIMSAVHARLVRKQLPRLNEDMLVEYAIFPPSTAPVTSPQGADLQWVLAAGSAKSKIDTKNHHESQRPRKKTTDVARSQNNGKHSRRYLSAGKQRQNFPWTSLDFDGGSYPRSAPVKQLSEPKANERQPPVVPRTMWGPESMDKPSANSQPDLKPQLTNNGQITNSGNSYQEIYLKKKVLANRSPLLQLSNSPGNSSIYKPSFAASDSPSSDKSFLSNSCPSTFFHRGEQRQPKENDRNDSNDSGSYPDPLPSPIRLKPTLARSAANRRERNSLNSTTSSVHDRVVRSPEIKPSDSSSQLERMLDQLHNHSNSAPLRSAMKAPHPEHRENKPFHPPPKVTNSGTWSPSTTKSPQKVKKRYTILPDNKAKDLAAYTAERPDRSDQSDHYSSISSLDQQLSYYPVLEKDPNEIDSQLSVIRRSAQNKRKQIQSQPTSSSTSGIADSISSSDTSLYSERSLDYSIKLDDDADYSLEDDKSKPSFKYNPNMGVTFDSKPVNSDVSVVGVGMGRNGSSLSESPSNISQLSSASLVSSSSGTKSPSSHHIDRTKKPRGGPTSPSIQSHSFEGSFNIQGKGVFSPTPSSTSLRSELDSPVIERSARETTKTLDGVLGKSVPQQDSLQKKNLSSSSFFTHYKEKETSHLKQDRSSPKILDSDPVSKSFPYSSPERSPTKPLAELRSAKIDSLKKKPSFNPSEMEFSQSWNAPSQFKAASSSTSVSSAGATRTPLDNPERNLTDAIKLIGSSDWEAVNNGLSIISRLAIYHPNVLASRFHDILVLLTKSVHNLRSQVSRKCVSTICDIYNNLKRPVLDTSVEIMIRALLTESGIANTFMKEEINKALQSVITSATPTKLIPPFLTVGQRHKNKTIRKTTAHCCSQIVEKMGPGKALSGVKDITDKLLDAVSTFIVDSSPDVRYYGRFIINDLMSHPDFNACLDKYLPKKSAQEIKDSALAIQQRGLGSSSSKGGRRNLSTTRMSGSAPGAHHRLSEHSSQASSSAPARRKAGSRNFSDLDHEEVKVLCYELSKGSFEERKNAVATLLSKADSNPALIEEHVMKVMDCFSTLLTTANIKLNSVALEALPRLIEVLGEGLKDSLSKLVPDLFKLIPSKANGDLALTVVDVLLKKVDSMLLLQAVGNAAQYGPTKARQVAIVKFNELVSNIGSRKMQVLERYGLPVLWNLLLSHKGGSAIQLKRELEQLTVTFYSLLDERLLDLAELKNVGPMVKEFIENSL